MTDKHENWSSFELRKFVTPEIIFGHGARHIVNQYIRNLGVGKVLLVTDPGVYDAGWSKETEQNLRGDGVACVVFADVESNPEDRSVMNGARHYLHEDCEAIVAVGGGSPIDCAKGIGIVATNGGNILDFRGIDHVEASIPPLICIPTTAGSAADISQFAIITDTKHRNKIEIVSKAIVPDVALNDPETLMTMDPGLTRATGLDTWIHAIESYVSNAHSPFTDALVLQAIRVVTESLPLSLHFPDRPEHRAKMLFACVNAGLGFSNTGLGAVHALAHPVGGLTREAHGECNAIMLPYVVAENYWSAPERYIEIGKAMGVPFRDSENQDTCKMELISHIARFMRVVGYDKSLSSFGVTEDDIPILSEHAHSSACLATNPKPLTLEQIESIYERAFRAK